MNPLLEDLIWRGLVKDHTDLQALSDRLDQGPVVAYCGYDPTADSLHIGSMQMIALMRRFQQSGHKVIALSGGATGLIGDPSGRSDERVLRAVDVVRSWTESINSQLKSMLPTDEGGFAPTFVNNMDWTAGLSILDFFRDVGKHFTVSHMLAKDSVKSRIQNPEAGLSYTEFSYMLLQAYDYLVLHEQHGCELQLGGSDQWGNIVAGLSLIGKKWERSCHGLTSPLVLRSDGRKFGKSEGQAIWLDKNKTSPFEMYQYLVNIPDTDVLDLLRRLTFLTRSEVDDLDQMMKQAPESRAPQRKLAEEVVKFVHGADAALTAEKITRWLFGDGEFDEHILNALSDPASGMPSYAISASRPWAWEELVIAAQFAPSKAEARRLIAGGGLSCWDERIEDPKSEVDLTKFARAGHLLLSRGRRKKALLRLDT